jgi:hypothetical protein
MSTCWEGGGWILSWSNKIIEGTYFRLPSQVRRAATEALPRSGGRHRRRAQAILFFVIKCYHYFSNLWIRLYVCIAILIVTEPWPMSDIFCRARIVPAKKSQKCYGRREKSHQKKNPGVNRTKKVRALPSKGAMLIDRQMSIEYRSGVRQDRYCGIVFQF